MKHLLGLAALLRREWRSLASADRGATATEYALVVAFIALVIVFSISFFGDSLASYFQQIASAVSTVL